MTCVKEQKRVLQSCHSDVTSGHFGVTKTWRRVAERFYWRGLYEDAKELVSISYVASYYQMYSIIRTPGWLCTPGII